MRDWTELAEILKKVRSAEQKFLGCWAAEEVLIPPGIERVAADITQGSCDPADSGQAFPGGEYLT